jgi:hypothetical protein
MTSFRNCFAWVSIIPLIVLHISRADLGDTLTSRPLAFTVFSGSNSPSAMEYPHFGTFMRAPTVQLNSVIAIYMVFLQLKRFSDRIKLINPHFRAKNIFPSMLKKRGEVMVLIIFSALVYERAELSQLMQALCLQVADTRKFLQEWLQRTLLRTRVL